MSLYTLLATFSVFLFALMVGTFSSTEGPPQVLAPSLSETIAIVRPSLPALTTKEPATPLPEPESTSKKTEVASVPTATVQKTVAPTPPPPPQPTQADFDVTANVLRAALINILCISHDPRIHSTSGSGVIVDPRGVIITNAHIAQYFLLAEDPSLQVTCTIRTGGPAKPSYRARLMFISPSWVNTNVGVLSKTHPTGNGEGDFAFLAITESITSTPLPTTYPFIPLAKGEADADEPIVIGSYAAQFLTANEVQSALYPTIVFGTVKAIFTFTERTIDVVALGGSAAAQEGSSGGGIARAPGSLAGVITTSTIEGNTSTRNLSGITASYIRRNYTAETGSTLEDLFAKSPSEAVNDFAPQTSALRAALTAALQN